MKFLNDITTGKDNATHDIARVVMMVNAAMLAVVLVLGVCGYFYGWMFSKAFDLQALFTAVLTYAGGVSALLTSGAAAIYFKRTTEPDGGEETIEKISKGA